MAKLRDIYGLDEIGRSMALIQNILTKLHAIPFLPFTKFNVGAGFAIWKCGRKSVRNLMIFTNGI